MSEAAVLDRHIIEKGAPMHRDTSKVSVAAIPESFAVLGDAVKHNPDLAAEMADRRRLVQEKEAKAKAETGTMPEYAQRSLRLMKEYLKDNPGATEEDIYHVILRGGDPTTYDIEGNLNLESVQKVSVDGTREEVLPWIQEEKQRVAFLERNLPNHTNLQKVASSLPSPWIQVDSLDESTESTETGRMYLNPRITMGEGGVLHVAGLFNLLVHRFQEQPDVLATAKCLNFTSAQFNQFPFLFAGEIENFLERLDRVVVYFDKAKQEEAVAFMKQIYLDTYQEWPYDANKPLFTDAVEGMSKDGTSFSLEGMGIADDPKKIDGEKTRSKGQTMATALLRAKEDVGSDRIDSPAFDQAFRGHLAYFGIDPQNPAYNLRTEESQPGETTDALLEASMEIPQESDLIEARREKHRRDRRPHWLFKRIAA